MNEVNSLAVNRNLINDFNQLRTNEQLRTSDETDVNIFGDIYNSFLGIYEQANNFQNELQSLQLDFASGKTDDILAVMMAQERAYASLNFAVQVTNNAMEAYREIMRMQI
jgi:flagellar hook-basal body complex protein FliE